MTGGGGEQRDRPQEGARREKRRRGAGTREVGVPRGRARETRDEQQEKGEASHRIRRKGARGTTVHM